MSMARVLCMCGWRVACEGGGRSTSGYSEAVCLALKYNVHRGFEDHRMPESLSAFCSIVSFTAAKTRRMFDVSVACVRLTVLAQ
jgi:hypothetical protein